MLIGVVEPIGLDTFVEGNARRLVQRKGDRRTGIHQVLSVLHSNATQGCQSVGVGHRVQPAVELLYPSHAEDQLQLVTVYLAGGPLEHLLDRTVGHKCERPKGGCYFDGIRHLAQGQPVVGAGVPLVHGQLGGPLDAHREQPV